MLAYTRRLMIGAVSAAALGMAMATPSFAAGTTLTWLTDSGNDSLAQANALIAGYKAKNPDVTIELETRPGGADGDNLVKTRLATGEMTDVFNYNSGSLFQAIKPADNLVDLSALGAQAGILDSFKTTVTATDGTVRGVPYGTAMGGGIFYNRKIYKELGLSVPKTWAEFIANCDKIKAAGKVAVAQTYKDTWTSQLFVLADFYNVQAAVPNFAADYTGNKAKYATTPAAMAGFSYLEQVFKGGYLNKDFGAATFPDGVRMVARGEAAHYPMLTFAIGAIKQDNLDFLGDVGFFAQPGASAEKNGLTVWMPAALYIPKTSKNAEEAKKFISFVASTEGCEIMTKAISAQGPYVIKGCQLPKDIPPALADLLPYFQENGRTAPALEFVSPVKGPSLEQITVEVGYRHPPRRRGRRALRQGRREAGQAAGPARLVIPICPYPWLSPGVRSSLEVERAMAQRPDTGNRFEVTIIVNQGQPVLDRDLGDATVEYAAHSFTPAAKIENNSRRLHPAVRQYFDIVLPVEIEVELLPLGFRSAALHQLGLREARHDKLGSAQEVPELFAAARPFFPHERHKHRGINQDHSDSAGSSCGRIRGQSRSCQQDPGDRVSSAA